MVLFNQKAGFPVIKIKSQFFLLII